MRISIIYGTEPNSFIYNQVHLLLEKININFPKTVDEFFISYDIPKRTSFDWYTFFMDEVANSNYMKSLDKIAHSLYRSDLIILASSEYSKDTIKQMNNLLNHLSYKWMPHKRKVSMSNKIAIAISDSSCLSFDLKYRTLLKNLRFWGINKDCIFKKNIIQNSQITNNKNYINLNEFALEIIKQYKKSCKIIAPNFNLNSYKNIALNTSHTESQKSCNKKKAPLLLKCFSNLKKAVHE